MPRLSSKHPKVIIAFSCPHWDDPSVGGDVLIVVATCSHLEHNTQHDSLKVTESVNKDTVSGDIGYQKACQINWIVFAVSTYLGALMHITAYQIHVHDKSRCLYDLVPIKGSCESRCV